MRRSPPVCPERARGFAPLLGRAPRLLILGSLPGLASLAAGEYYAHPRNLFWDFMGELFGAGRDLSYAARSAGLGAARIAVWDVLAEATRPGSLDTSIDLASARHNDIAALLQREPTLGTIAFNGAAAERLFQQRIARELGQLPRQIRYLPLPSTSPANAGRSRADKLAQWQALTRCGLDPAPSGARASPHRSPSRRR
jgi:TDG/mug DNA glycosylase family protein